MCGIAGFNASPAWVDAHINEKVQYHMLECAWLYNQHRGRDAAGYFRVDKQTSEVHVRKAPIAAFEILDENAQKPVLSPAVVFGAHTRSATLGDPNDDRNNHPVTYQNLIITHNGTISNHNKYKNAVPLDNKDQVGEVDSNAIAIALDRCATPYDIEGIKNQLKGLDGSLAIHAVWKNSPGVSLLARGKSSPLIFRYHPDGFLCYSSVDDANYNMITAMGMDPNDDAWEVKELNEFSFLIVESGVPIMWASYSGSGWQPAMNQLKYHVSRVIGGNKQNVAYETDQKTYWGADVKDRSLKAAKRAKRTDLIYSQKQGFLEKKKIKFPVVGSVKPWDKITEADLVYENTDQNIIYAKYGDIEIIIDADSSKLLDVYNHKKFPNQLRYTETNKRSDLPKDASFDDWLEDATRPIKSPVKEMNEPLFKRHRIGQHKHKNPTAGGLKIAPKAPETTYNTAPNGETEMNRATSDTAVIYEPDVIDLGMDVTWMNIDNFVLSSFDEMAWLNDIKCKEHNALYSRHQYPASCDATLLASIAFASCITDITLWYRVDQTLEIITRKKRGNGISLLCTDNGEQCIWEGYLYRQVFIGANKEGFDQVVEVLMGEKCTKCESKMFIRRLPEYMEWWTGDKRYVN